MELGISCVKEYTVFILAPEFFREENILYILPHQTKPSSKQLDLSSNQVRDQWLSRFPHTLFRENKLFASFLTLRSLATKVLHLRMPGVQCPQDQELKSFP